jgi:hypothetical protein
MALPAETIRGPGRPWGALHGLCLLPCYGTCEEGNQWQPMVEVTL